MKRSQYVVISFRKWIKKTFNVDSNIQVVVDRLASTIYFHQRELVKYVKSQRVRRF